MMTGWIDCPEQQMLDLVLRCLHSVDRPLNFVAWVVVVSAALNMLTDCQPSKQVNAFVTKP